MSNMDFHGNLTEAIDYSCNNLVKSEPEIEDNNELPLNLSVKSYPENESESSSSQIVDNFNPGYVASNEEYLEKESENIAKLFGIKTEPDDDFEDDESLNPGLFSSLNEYYNDSELESMNEDDESYNQNTDTGETQALPLVKSVKTESICEDNTPVESTSHMVNGNGGKNYYNSNGGNSFNDLNVKSEPEFENECNENNVKDDIVSDANDDGDESDATIEFDPESEEFSVNKTDYDTNDKQNFKTEPIDDDFDDETIKVEKVSFNDDQTIATTAKNTNEIEPEKRNKSGTHVTYDKDGNKKRLRICKRTYQCAVCGEQFKQCKDFRDHKLIHKDGNPMHCRICGTVFNEYDNMSQHMRRTHGHYFRCELCGKSFKQSKNLENHLATHTGGYKYYCKICGRGFSQKFVLGAHIRTHKDRPFKCHVCTKGFSQECFLKRHLIIHSDYKPFKCDSCGQGFNQKGNLKKHLIRYCGDVKFPCEYCGLEFTYKQLPYHCRTHNEKPYKCEECGRKFEVRMTYENHIHKHGMEKPFKCDECDKAFTQQNALLKHKKLHTDEKPFKCEVCGKSFNQKGNLKQHALTHTDNKPFECDICGKCFYQSCYLMTHRRTHTGNKPFKCDECGKCFNTSSNLKQHSRTHSGERPFKCDTCGKCFSQKNNFENHLRTHTGDKPFECQICGRCFNQKSNLNQHLKSCRKKVMVLETIEKPLQSGLSFSNLSDTLKSEIPITKE